MTAVNPSGQWPGARGARRGTSPRMPGPCWRSLWCLLHYGGSVPFNKGFPVQGDLRLTPDGRDIQLVSGARKVAQNIRVRAQTFKGSWRYDRNVGMPYFQDILVFGASSELIRRRFHDLLTGTDGVLSVQSLTLRFDRTHGIIYVEFVVITDTSEVLRDVLDFQAVA